LAPLSRILGGSVTAELGEIALCEKDRAGMAQPGDHGRIGLGDPLGVEGRTALGPKQCRLVAAAVVVDDQMRESTLKLEAETKILARKTLELLRL
jgi:hypothetical protein